jgi:hypothetical protein
MEKLAEQVIENIFGGNIILDSHPSIRVITNMDLYGQCPNYKSICIEILKDTTLKKSLFVFINDDETDAYLKAEKPGKDLVIKFVMRRAVRGTGKFANVDSLNLQLEKIHQFCTYLNEGYNASKNDTFIVN